MAASIQTRRAILLKLREFRRTTAKPSDERRLRRQGIEGYRQHALEVIERDEGIEAVGKALDVRPLYRDPRFARWSTDRWRCCVRGAVQKVAARLMRRKTAGDENPVRQLLITVLRQKVLDWSGCTGLVHQMVQSYVWHKAPVDEARPPYQVLCCESSDPWQILSLARRMFDPVRATVALTPSASMLRLLLTVTQQRGDADVFRKTWTSLVKPVLLKHFGGKVPISVSSAYIGGCLFFDYPLTLDEALHDDSSHTSKAIGELIQMNNPLTSDGGPLLASDVLIRLIRQSSSPAALQLVLNSRLGRRRISRKEQKGHEMLFLHDQKKQTPLQFLWDGTMRPKSHRLGGPVSRTAMLAYLRCGYLQQVTQIVSSHTAAPKPSMVLNTMLQIGDQSDHPQMMKAAFRQILVEDVVPHVRHVRRLLVRLADPLLPYGFRGRPERLIGFVDSYLPLVSVRDAKALFLALNVSESMPDVILCVLKRLMRPDFDPEERLGLTYPFAVSKHYRQFQKTIQLLDHQQWQERHGIDDRWRFRVLLTAGHHLRQRPIHFSQLLRLAEEWFGIVTAFRSTALTRGTWAASADDAVFSVLLSFLIRPQDSPELLKRGSLFHLMRLGMMAGMLPGAKSRRTLYYFTQHVTESRGRPFTYYRQSYPLGLLDVNEIMRAFDRPLPWSIDHQRILSSVLCRHLIEDCFRHIADARGPSLPLT